MVRCSRAAACCALLFSGVVAMAGPLNPPAGPVAPSVDPPGEIEPRININALPGSATAEHVIDEQGSYYLTANIVADFGKGAIHVTTFRDVTIDLNGYEVAVNTAGGVITIQADTSGKVTIINGHVAAFEDAIVADRAVLDRVSVTSTIDPGVRLTKSVVSNSELSGEFTDCTLQNCRLPGSPVLTRSVATNCHSSLTIQAVDSSLQGCWALGFVADGSTLERCVAARLSEFTPASGFQATGSTLTGCVALGSSSDGFRLESASSAIRCRADENTGAGFLAFDGSSMTDCTARGNADGFSLNSGSSARGCTASENNALGFFVNDRSTVQDCVATDNVNSGFQFGAASKASSCTAIGHANVGFAVSAGVIGVEVTDCSAVGNDVGFLQESPSLIARNRASLNATNYNMPLAGAFPVSAPGAGVDAWDNIEY